MTIQTPQTQAIQVTQTPALPPDLAPVLSVGRVLQVDVREGPNQQPGIMVAGRFLPATLPPGVSTGQQLAVQVLSNTDSIVLKVLAQPGQLQVTPAAQLEGQIRALLSDPRLPQVLFSNEPPRDAQAKPGTELQSPQTQKLQAALEKLLQSDGILSKKDLENPEQLFKSLHTVSQERSIQSLSKQLGEAQRSLEQITKHELNTAELRFLKSFSSEVEKFLQEYFPAPPNPLLAKFLPDGSPDKTPPPPTPFNPQIFERRLKQLLTVLQDTENSILSNRAQSEFGSASEEVRSFLTTLSREFGTLVARRAEPNELREVLVKALVQLQKHFDTSDKKAALAGTLQASRQLLNSLEQLTQAQETLRTLNPLLEATGQQIMLLIPLISEGFLGHGTVAADPMPIGDEGGPQRHKGGKNGFERVELNFNMPGLGLVNINLAHRKGKDSGELFLNISVSDKERSDFISQSVVELETRLRELGYEKTTLQFGLGNDRSAAMSAIGQLLEAPPRIA